MEIIQIWVSSFIRELYSSELKWTNNETQSSFVKPEYIWSRSVCVLWTMILYLTVILVSGKQYCWCISIYFLYPTTIFMKHPIRIHTELKIVTVKWMVELEGGKWGCERGSSLVCLSVKTNRLQVFGWRILYLRDLSKKTRRMENTLVFLSFSTSVL